MSARTKSVKVKEYQHGIACKQKSSRPPQNQLRINYYQVRKELDPYPDLSLLDPIDSVQDN